MTHERLRAALPAPGLSDHKAVRTDDLAALLSEHDALAAVAEAARTARDNIGVPNEGYPAPVAYAYDVLNDALAAYDRTVAKP